MSDTLDAETAENLWASIISLSEMSAIMMDMQMMVGASAGAVEFATAINANRALGASMIKKLRESAPEFYAQKLKLLVTKVAAGGSAMDTVDTGLDDTPDGAIFTSKTDNTEN